MIKTWLILITLSVVDCSYNVLCGPGYKCNCNVQSGAYNSTKMDCLEIGYKGLSDICKSIGIATQMTVTELDISRSYSSLVIRNRSEMIGCEQLQVLNLGNSKLKWIGKNALDGLIELKVLILSNNKLEVYAANGLSNLTKLEKLETLTLNANINASSTFVNLSYPNIALFPKLKTLYMDGLTNTAFDMSYANLSSLTLGHPVDKRYLSPYFTGCYLGNLTIDTFKQLSNIRNLTLSNCNIEVIEAETFATLKYLDKLDLSYNRRLGFRSLRNVSYGLQFTNIKYLDYSYVYNTFGLGNVVRKKDLCYFRNLSITELVLEGNNIQLFETNALMLLPKMLEVIRLDDNKLTFAPYVFQGACVQHLQEVYISYQSKFHNPIVFLFEDNVNIAEQEVDDDPDECPYIEDEFLKSISKEIPFCNFYEPTCFNISSNFEDLWFPFKTTKIVMRGNFMKVAQPRLYIQSQSVEYLDLSDNHFYTWLGITLGSSTLKYLDLSRNYCLAMNRKFFIAYNNLQNLQISENFIGLSLYGGIFDGLSSLRVFNLSSNVITTLPKDLFKNLFNLETLDLSFNSIENLNIDPSSLLNLTTLDLSHNSLPTLSMALAEHLANISEQKNIPFTINMRHNSIKVSCQYENFLKWMIHHQSNFVGFESYTFVDDNNIVIQPSDLKKCVKRLSKSCRSYTLLIVICSIGLSVFLAVVIGGVIFRNRWKLRYLLYMAKRRYNGYMAIPDGEPQLNYRYDAFISYSEDDIRFILDEIIPKVEEHNLELCIHQRDFVPGIPIADNIMDAIQNSKMTVVVLTDAYLRSKWCVYEFNMARMESMYSRNNEISLLFIMLENVPMKHMSLEMVQWIKDNSYLEYKEDPECELLFWDSLKDALAH